MATIAMTITRKTNTTRIIPTKERLVNTDGLSESANLTPSIIIIKDLEDPSSYLLIHTDDGSKKFKLTNTTTWFDKIIKFEPYEEKGLFGERIINLAPNNNMFLKLGGEKIGGAGNGISIIFNCDD